MSNKGVKLPKPKKIRKKAAEKNRRPSLTGIVLGIITILGGILAPLAYLPRPSVSVSEPVDADNPLSSAFTVTNGNIIPLWDVRLGIAPGDMGIGRKTLEGDRPLSDDSGFLFMPKWEHHYLRMDEQFTITPSDLLNIQPPTSLTRADLAIIVQYYPWFLPIQRSRAFRFEAHRQTNGHFYWYPTPLK
jgi:hypothetical protein